MTLKPRLLLLSVMTWYLCNTSAEEDWRQFIAKFRSIKHGTTLKSPSLGNIYTSSFRLGFVQIPMNASSQGYLTVITVIWKTQRQSSVFFVVNCSSATHPLMCKHCRPSLQAYFNVLIINQIRLFKLIYVKTVFKVYGLSGGDHIELACYGDPPPCMRTSPGQHLG